MFSKMVTQKKLLTDIGREYFTLSFGMNFRPYKEEI